MVGDAAFVAAAEGAEAEAGLCVDELSNSGELWSGEAGPGVTASTSTRKQQVAFDFANAYASDSHEQAAEGGVGIGMDLNDVPWCEVCRRLRFGALDRVQKGADLFDVGGHAHGFGVKGSSLQPSCAVRDGL
ncbi:MAG: hypothetical protein JNL98_17745 [Bryobacterales bacterium]|nr:hypothetical protein [Bryobacterales bacterium]